MSFAELVQMSCSGGGGGAGQSIGGTGLADSAAGSMLIESCELGSLTVLTSEPNRYRMLDCSGSNKKSELKQS